MLLTRGGQSYTNDAAGNTLTGGGRTMTWDAQNRMVTCSYGGVNSTFTYGADGLRRRMVVGANTTDYLLDGQNVVRETLNGQVNAFYLYGPRGPEYRRDQTGNVAWYLYDGLGSVVATVDSSGNMLDARKYDVYGAVRSGGAGTRHKFCGQLGHASDDETGLIYMRARYMDPATGRFVSQDPERDGRNWFAYCGADPANLVDANGKMAGGLITGADVLEAEVTAASGAFTTGASLIARLGAACGEWSLKMWAALNGSTVTLGYAYTRTGDMVKGFFLQSDTGRRIFFHMQDVSAVGHRAFPHVDLQVGGGALWEELQALLTQAGL